MQSKAAEDRFFEGMKLLSPRVKACVQNEQHKGIIAFKMITYIFKNMGGDFKKLCQDNDYDPEISPISIEEMEEAARKAGFATVEEFQKMGDDGENIRRAREMGYLPKESGLP